MKYHDTWKVLRWPLTAVALAIAVVRRRKPFMMFGVYWTFCCHRSHHRRLRCWRWFQYDGYCARHNRTCYSACKTDAT